jgi:hypothetical protein
VSVSFLDDPILAGVSQTLAAGASGQLVDEVMRPRYVRQAAVRHVFNRLSTAAPSRAQRESRQVFSWISDRA